MSNWRTTAITLPEELNDADLPSPLTSLAGFRNHAKDVAIDIEAGGSVELQRVNSSGAWETFETVTEAADFVIVANRPAIRFSPVSSASFKVTWSA